LETCAKAQKPLVLCTTGLDSEAEAKVRETAGIIPVFFSANMSLGINLLIELCQKAASILAPAGFDIEINERHHNRKIDAPSGTALSIGRSLIETLGGDYHMTTDRCDKRQARDPHEIGMTAMRGGTIVGEHEVLFCGKDEVISLSHSAASREVFATGALRAAHFMAGRCAGFYNMDDVIGDL
jgi:4-hydroxy-tetrahydrodipicolinate reductase